ncbi:MAG: hypothetical protein ACLTDR_06740 [Adlercreutzia equolifaciens]
MPHHRRTHSEQATTSRDGAPSSGRAPSRPLTGSVPSAVRTDAINLLSDLGLAFLFLLAGYEISPKSLTGTEGKRGAATWAVTFAIAFVVVAIWPTPSAFGAGRPGRGHIARSLPRLHGQRFCADSAGARHPGCTRMGMRSSPTAPGGELLPIIAMALLPRPGPPGRTVVILLLAFPRHRRGGRRPCRRSPSASAAMCTGSSSPMRNTNTQMVIRSVNSCCSSGSTAVSAVFRFGYRASAPSPPASSWRHPHPYRRPDHGDEAQRRIAYGFLVPLCSSWVSGRSVDACGLIGAEPELLGLFITHFCCPCARCPSSG